MPAHDCARCRSRIFGYATLAALVPTIAEGKRQASHPSRKQIAGLDDVVMSGRFEFEFEFEGSACPPEEDGRRHAGWPPISRNRVLPIEGRADLLLPLLKFASAIQFMIF